MIAINEPSSVQLGDYVYVTVVALSQKEVVMRQGIVTNIGPSWAHIKVQLDEDRIEMAVPWVPDQTFLSIVRQPRCGEIEQ